MITNQQHSYEFQPRPSPTFKLSRYPVTACIFAVPFYGQKVKINVNAKFINTKRTNLEAPARDFSFSIFNLFKLFHL